MRYHSKCGSNNAFILQHPFEPHPLPVHFCACISRFITLFIPHISLFEI